MDFTPQTEKIFRFAQTKAWRLGHKELAWWHVLYAILQEGTTAAATAVESLGLTAPILDQEMQKLHCEMDKRPGERQYSKTLTRILEDAENEAAVLNDGKICPGCITLAALSIPAIWMYSTPSMQRVWEDHAAIEAANNKICTELESKYQAKDAILS